MAGPSTTTENLELSSPYSLRSWTIPRPAGKLRRMVLPFPATARKAELYKLFITNTCTPQPGVVLHPDNYTEIKGLRSSLLASIITISSRLEKCETPQSATANPPVETHSSSL
ncbi:Hypothetical predicted protein [Pelobates cultripes]|uniref:Uncharacterized protein n=1 Tax=Pelobates cultripes TaxID=61616 RepID=A0AAD1WC26_PELCU|nr:Hypothetical predicted protein [Pelobates cultripes]